MKKWILAIIIFLFPSVIVMFFLRLLGYKIGRNCRIGFSWVIVNELEMADYAKIGHLNFIYIPLLHMGQASYIKIAEVPDVSAWRRGVGPWEKISRTVVPLLGTERCRESIRCVRRMKS